MTVSHACAGFPVEPRRLGTYYCRVSTVFPHATLQVQFALLKFVFGTGAFARTKILFLHINGEKCSALKRGRLNTRKGAAKVRDGWEGVFRVGLWPSVERLVTVVRSFVDETRAGSCWSCGC